MEPSFYAESEEFFMAVAAFETIQTPESYIFVDDLPGVYDERLVIRDAAREVLETRRLHEQQGVVEQLPIDALSTAHNVLHTRATYGRESEQYQESWSGLLLDCERLVGEWYRKNTSEYFEPTRHVFRHQEGEFFSDGLSIRKMTENALVPISEDPEEEARRVNERVEEETPKILRSLGSVALGRGIVTISECTDSAIKSYESDMRQGQKHRGYRGYVPEIQKLMVRHVTLDAQTDDRFQTQIGLPGTHLTHEVIQEALVRRGLDDAQTMSKTELHGAQFLADEDPMDFIAYLDEVASEQWCVPIFMGEPVSNDFVKDYEGYKQEAAARKESLAEWSETVALFVLDLAEDNFDRKKAPAHVESFVKNMLLTMAKEDETVALQAFDAKTVDGLRQVRQLEQRGMYDLANELWKTVEQKAPGGGSCGAGSCGLEGVLSGSKEDAALRKRLGASDGDTLVKDKERACKCGSKSIVYAYNKQKVIKYCESCNAYEKSYKKAA